jgi:hypothetical protein
MIKNRDNFSRATTEIMAKRVGYLCSNPFCRQLTIGANEIENKSTSIGIGAHITAAATGGPRYDENLTVEHRSHINNGIWLCSNCSKLIDTDIEKYSIKVLQDWKQNAEEETQKKLNGEFRNQPIGIPYLETDLIGNFGSRWNKGYSDKNPVEMYEGKQHIIISHRPIIHWALDWNFNFVIYNNSNYPAFNVQVESIGNVHFSYIDKLPKINNLPPLQNIDLKAKYEDYVEGDYTVAEEITNSKIPVKFDELTLRIKYFEENRKEHNTFVEFKNGEIINRIE